MAGRVAGQQDVFGAGRPCGEPERGGTPPAPPEAGTRGCSRPAALPGGRPRRVPGCPGPARRREDPGSAPGTGRIPCTGCSWSSAGRASSRRARPADAMTGRPSRNGWPRRRPGSSSWWRTAGRTTRRRRPAWSTRPGPAACGSPEDSAPDCTRTGGRRPGRSPAPSRRPATRSSRTRSRGTRTPDRQSPP